MGRSIKAMTPEDAEREADKILASTRAKQARYRIERQSFTEEEGRTMYRNVAGSSGPRRKVAVGWGYQAAPLTIEAGRDVVQHALFGGRSTPGAIVSRICALAVQMGELSITEAARISRKSERTIRRNGRDS